MFFNFFHCITHKYFNNGCRNYNVRFQIQCHILLWFSSIPTVSTCARMRSRSTEVGLGDMASKWYRDIFLLYRDTLYISRYFDISSKALKNAWFNPLMHSHTSMMILVVPATYVCIKPFLFILYSLEVSIRTILNLCAKGVNHNEVKFNKTVFIQGNCKMHISF